MKVGRQADAKEAVGGTQRKGKTMKTCIWPVAAVALSMVLLHGCGKGKGNEAENSKRQDAARQEAGADAASRGPRILGDDAVLIRCGTNEFTMGEAKDFARLRASLARLSISGANRAMKLEEAFLPRVIAALPLAFPTECAIAEFARENAIAAGKEDMELMRRRAQRNAKQEFVSWGAFLRKLPKENRSVMEERVHAEALQEAVRKWHERNKPISVSDEQIAGFRRRQRDYNARAAATNDFTFALATNVWREIEAGLPFEEAVEKYSTDEEESAGGEWGDFALDYFGDTPDLQRMIVALEPGQMTPPVEGDNGLMIVRLDDIQNDANGAPVYSLSRIFFHLPEFYPELDDEAFAKEIRRTGQEKAFYDFVRELAGKQKIVYPEGEAVFEDAKRTAAQPVMF